MFFKYVSRLLRLTLLLWISLEKRSSKSVKYESQISISQNRYSENILCHGAVVFLRLRTDYVVCGSQYKMNRCGPVFDNEKL